MRMPLTLSINEPLEGLYLSETAHFYIYKKIKHCFFFCHMGIFSTEVLSNNLKVIINGLIGFQKLQPYSMHC